MARQYDGRPHRARSGQGEEVRIKTATDDTDQSNQNSFLICGLCVHLWLDLSLRTIKLATDDTDDTDQSNQNSFLICGLCVHLWLDLSLRTIKLAADDTDDTDQSNQNSFLICGLCV
jgi:L-ribulose-5-phosphate 3-epimerase UlaE